MKFVERLKAQHAKRPKWKRRSKVPERVVRVDRCIGVREDGTRCGTRFSQIIWQGVGICELCPACVREVEQRIAALHARGPSATGDRRKTLNGVRTRWADEEAS